MKNTTKKIKIRHIVLCILSVIALGVCVYTLGKPHVSHFSVSTNFCEPRYASFDKDNNLNALTDNHYLRISSFTPDQHTQATTSISYISNQTDLYFNIVKSGDECFVLHAQYDLDSGYLIKEEILALDNNFHTVGSVYSQDYNTFKDHVKVPRILDLTIEEDALYLVKISNQNFNEIQTIKIENVNNVYYGNIDTGSQIKVVQSVNLPFMNDSVINAKYNPVCNKTVFTSFFGAIYQISGNNNLECVLESSPDISFYDVCIDNNSNIFATDTIAYRVHHVQKNTHRLLDLNVDANFIDIYNNNLVVGDSNTNSVIMYDSSTLFPITIINSAPYSVYLLVYSLLTSLSIVYIALLIVGLCIKGLIYFKNNAKSSSKKLFFAGLLTTIVLLCICAVFASTSYSQLKEAKKQSLEMLCFHMAQTNSSNIEKANKNLSDESQRNQYYNEFMGNLETYYYAYSLGEGTYLEYSIFSKSQLINYFKQLDIDIEEIDPKNLDAESLERYNLLITAKVDNTNMTIDSIHRGVNNEVEVFSGEFSNDEGWQIYAASPIYSISGDIVGFVSVESPVVQLIARQIQLGIELFAMFLVVFCALSLLFIELYDYYKSIKKAKAIKKGLSKGKTEICGMRFLFFLVTFLTLMIISFCVIVTKDIIKAQGTEVSDAILGLPLSLYFVGAMLGYLLAKIYLLRISARNFQIISVCVLIMVSLLTVFAVISSNLWLFAFCMLGLGVFTYDMLFLVESIQYQTEDEKTQKILINKIFLALVSGSALGTLSAGYVSQYIGNYAIYILYIIVSILILLNTLYFIPRKVYFKQDKANQVVEKSSSVHSESNHKNSSSTTKEELSTKNRKKIIDNNTLRFILKPQMLAVFVLLIFVSIVAGRYLSVLFPLMAQDCGINKAQIGNINLIAACVVFLLSLSFQKYILKANQKIVACAILFVMGFPLLCFMLNSSLVWIVLVLLPIRFGFSLANSTYKLVWAPLADKMRIDNTSIMFFIVQARELSKVVSPVLVTSLLCFGQIQACIIIGIVTIVSGVLFWIVSRKM